MYPLCLRPGAGQGLVSVSVQTSKPKSRPSALALARAVEAKLGARVGLVCGARGVPALRESSSRHSGSRLHGSYRSLPRSTRAQAGAEAEAEAEKRVMCTLQVRRTVDYGSELLVMGDAYALGQWDKDYAPMMQWSEGDVWSCEVAVPEGEEMQFKFVVQTRRHDLQWEEFRDNRKFTVPSTACTYTADWNNEDAEFKVEEETEVTEEIMEEEETLPEEAETPDRAAIAVSELVQLTSEVLSSDEDRNAKAAGFEQTLADKLETLRQTLDESGSNSLEEFVLALTQVSREGMSLRDEHYKDINQKEQENFKKQIAAQEEKVAKLTEEVELCVPRDDELTKLNEAELMTALSKAELLTKLTKAEMSEKVKALERSLASESARVTQLTQESKSVKESSVKELKEVQNSLAAEVEKVRKLTKEAAKVRDLESALAAEVEKVESLAKARGVDKSKALERTLAEKRVLAEKLTKESIKVSRLEKLLAKLEERAALAKSSDNIKLAERAAVAEDKLAEMVKELKDVKAALAQKNKSLDVSRESMQWRDNLYATKLQKAEEAMQEMQRRERANWAAFKKEHEALMAIMRQANVDLERELAVVRAELARRDGQLEQASALEAKPVTQEATQDVLNQEWQQFTSTLKELDSTVQSRIDKIAQECDSA